MKTSAFLISYGNRYEQGASTFDLVDIAKEQGFDAVEPYPVHDLATVEDARHFADYAGKKGLGVSCFSVPFNLAIPDKTEAVATLKHYIDMAQAMGAPYFHHTIALNLETLRVGGDSFETLLPGMTPIIRELCDYASEHGVTCVYEDQGMCFNGTERFVRFVEAVDRKNMGVVADLGNIMFADETPEQFVGRFTSRIVHVHLKDYLWKSGTEPHPGAGWYMTERGNFLRDTVFGHGSVHFEQVFRLLHAAGYDGYYSCEYCAPEPFEKWIPISMENVKRFYRNVL